MVGSSLERCFFYLAFDGQFKKKNIKTSVIHDGLLLILCVSSPPVHLLSAVWPKPGWPISTWDRPHLQDGQGKVSEQLCVIYSKWD